MKEYKPFLSIEEARRNGDLNDLFSDDKRIKKRRFVLIEEIPDSLGSPEDILIAREDGQTWEGGCHFIEVNTPSTYTLVDTPPSTSVDILRYGHKRVKKPWWRKRFNNQKVKEAMAEH